jgi:Flp pilus assembly protein TadD
MILRIHPRFATLLFCTLMVAALAMKGPVRADQSDERLADLFESLKDTEDAGEARKVQLEISGIWEGWNQRAILNFMTDRDDDAILDIRKTVSLEPRHFGAWSGLGQIFESINNDRAALQAYRQALSVNPHLESAERAIKRLEKDVEGQGI